MNTPGHAVVNLLVLGSRDRPFLFAPIALGAVLPDLPMLLFYAHEKLWLRTPEFIIWNQSYNKIGWQTSFDIFHALPLVAVAFLLARRAKFPRAAAALASMMLHSVCDLGLHHNDAHRHFFPLSEWRFSSPVSYWDPLHFGLVVSSVELLVVLVGTGVLFRHYHTRGPRVLLSLILASYALYLGYALVVWI